MEKDDFKNLIIKSDSSIKKAISQLNETQKKALFSINIDGKLIGSITDGDIRRAILKGIDLSTSVSKIMFMTPRFITTQSNDPIAEAKKLMINHNIEQIPVLNEKGVLKDIIGWHQVFDEKLKDEYKLPQQSTPVVIMAGGRGTRLDPLTKILPKPLIPLGEKPLIEIIMDNFEKKGFSNFYMTLNYKKELIKAFFCENGSSKHKVIFFEESKYMGTAGGLQLLRNTISEPFFVTNCDTILEIEFDKILEYHLNERAAITLIGSHKELKIPYGLIKCNDEHFQGLKEKPVIDLIINTGAYLCSPSVFSFIAIDECIDMNELIKRVDREGKIAVYPIYDGWFDAGQFREYHETLRKIETRIL